MLSSLMSSSMSRCPIGFPSRPIMRSPKTPSSLLLLSSSSTAASACQFFSILSPSVSIPRSLIRKSPFCLCFQGAATSAFAPPFRYCSTPVIFNPKTPSSLLLEASLMTSLFEPGLSSMTSSLFTSYSCLFMTTSLAMVPQKLTTYC